MDFNSILMDAKSRLDALPSRPSSIDVSEARQAIADIEKKFTVKVEELLTGFSAISEETKLLQSSKISSAKAEADSLKSKHLHVLALEEQHVHYEGIIRKVQTAVVDRKELDMTEASRQEASRKLLLDIEALTQQEKLEADLSERQIEDLPEQFGNIKSLLHLNLSANLLQTIPDSVAGLVNLRVLDVSKNRLTSLPDSIGALTNLQVLDVSKNNLTQLPETLWSCGNLEELNAFYNKLDCLPLKFAACLPHLKRLNLGFNKLQKLPEDIGRLSELTFLDTHFNRLQGVPDSIGDLKKLQILDLSDNFADLVRLPASLGNLLELRVLRLRNNQIAELPAELGRLCQLDELALEGNPWVEPPYELAKSGSLEAIIDYLQERYRASLNPDPNQVAFSDWAKWVKELLAGGNWQLANFISALMSGTSSAKPGIGGVEGSASGGQPTAEIGLLEIKEIADLEGGGGRQKEQSSAV